MTNPIVVKSWDQLPPVVSDQGEYFSTRLLERKYREMKITLEAIAMNGLDASQCRRAANIALGVERS